LSVSNKTSWQSKLRYFPLRSGEKFGNTGWQSQATNDSAQIKYWLEAGLDLGILCGEASDLLVVDEDGENAIATLEQHVGKSFPLTHRVQTSPGKTHHYFKHPLLVLKNSVKFLPGLDIRTTGGLVVAAGAKSIPGRIYQSLDDLEPIALDMDFLWAIEKLQCKKAKSNVESQPERIYGIGERDNHLISIAGKWKNSGMEYEHLLAALQVENKKCNPPLPKKDLERLAHSGSLMEQHEVPELHHTILAARFVAQYTGLLRHLSDDKSWWVYNPQSGLWLERPDEPRQECVKMLEEFVPSCDNPKMVDKLRSKTLTVSILYFAECDSVLAAPMSEFNPDSWLLALPDCLCLDLKSGITRKSRAEDLFTRSLATAPAKEVSQEWLSFLNEIQPDAEIRGFLKRFLGYCLTAETDERVIVTPYGNTATGKGTLLTPIQWILGSYCVELPDVALLEETGEDRKYNYLVKLCGARLAIINELSQSRRLDSVMMKRLSGGSTDKVNARRLNHQPIEFFPTHKLMIPTNDLPVLRLDDAMKDRIRVVPFTQKWGGKSAPDKGLKSFFSRPEQLAGILRWMIEGCLEWREKGLLPPASVVDNTEDYFQEFDLLERFLEANTIPGEFAPTMRLFFLWTEHCKASNEIKSIGSVRTFTHELLIKRPDLKTGRKTINGKQISGFYGIQIPGESNEY
jgi:putative DNA primase/helicase